MNNLYWSVYKNLEKELLILADQIHIDDNQLNVYSIKIAELLMRTSMEIEAISKELYFTNGGNNQNKQPNEFFFDTDCIEFLDKEWNITQKEILISSPYLYFENNENKILTPLTKANKRNKCDWKKAYQGIKHDRGNNLKKTNLKHFIRALGALYILNIYYKGDEVFKGLEPFNSVSLNSDVFSVTGRQIPITLGTGEYSIPDKKCICIQKYKDEDFLEANYLAKKGMESLSKIIEESTKFQKFSKENLKKMDIFSLLIKIFPENYKEIFNKHYKSLSYLKNKKLLFILNKNQNIYPIQTTLEEYITNHSSDSK